MEIQLPPETPENVRLAYNESVRVLQDATNEGNTKSAKYQKQKKARATLGYILLGTSLIASIFITANVIPSQLAILVAIIYAIDRTLSNSRRVVAVAQAAQAYSMSVGIMARSSQTGQVAIFAAESDKVEMVRKITALNQKLAEEIHARFTAADQAIAQSDIETLQALALDQDKLNIATRHLQSGQVAADKKEGT